MTKKEEKTINELLKAVQDLRKSNEEFRENIEDQVESINNKTEKKHLPIHLEQDILVSVQQSIDVSIKNALQDNYNSPLKKLIISVVDEHSDELRKLISDSFTNVIRKDEFKQSIINAFSHKVSRSIISNNDGLFDKVSNELKQDTIFKSKMALAVSNVVEECLREDRD